MSDELRERQKTVGAMLLVADTIERRLSRLMLFRLKKLSGDRVEEIGDMQSVNCASSRQIPLKELSFEYNYREQEAPMDVEELD